MKVVAFSLTILSFLTLSTCQSKKEALKEEIEKFLKAQQGDFAVAFKELTSGEEILIHEQEVFHAASTMKTPVMIEVYKQAKEGKLSLTDSVTVKNEFKSIVDGSPYRLSPVDDSEPMIYDHVGKKQTLYALVYNMITASSNLATNIIIEMVDAKKVTQTMRDLGAKDIQVLRGVEDNKAFKAGLINTTTAFDLMTIFEKIAKGEAVDRLSCKIMINILLDQKYNTIIPAKLPRTVTVAHKTGWLTGVNHDSGIVFMPNGKSYVLVLLSKNVKDERKAIEAMATVSLMIYQYEDLNRK